MSESLKNRVGRVIAGSVHALIDRIEDQAPEAMMEQSIRAAENVIDEVRHELGTVSANRHLAQQQHARLNGEHAGLAEQIDQALLAERDDMARAAVARQLDIEAQLPVLETTLGELTRQETELQGYVTALLAKKREMQEALAAFRRSRTAAGTQTATMPRSDPMQRIAGVVDAFDRLFERQTGLSGTARTTGPAQAARLQELEEFVRNNQIAERMARLKAGQP